MATTEHDHERLSFARRLRDDVKRLSRFGARVADDILPREMVARAARALEILSHPVMRPVLKRDLPPDRLAGWSDLGDGDPRPVPSDLVKTVSPYTTAAFLVDPRGIRLGVSGDIGARHHLSRLKGLVVGEVVNVVTPRVDFCLCVDDREIGPGEAKWWVPLRERWLELKHSDHAVAFYEPRIFELIDLDDGITHVWGSDPAIPV